MEKMLISFSDPQARWLRERAVDLDISVSELVRRMLDEGRRAYEIEQSTLAGARRSLAAMEQELEREPGDEVRAHLEAGRAIVHEHER